MYKAVDDYLEKKESPQREICQKLREIIFKTMPHIKEEMKWGVPSYANGRFYLVSLKDHVNLGFSLKTLSETEQKLLEGSGKTMRHIEIRSLEGIDEKRIVDLLKIVGKE
ncbi:MAG: hypothetical protein QG670_734 [Thermoproteota archaeon]|nr:hypothetical protein [Thermoproteota archaeon]